MSTNIKEWHKQFMKQIRSEEGGNFVLMSCFLNGKPSVAICTIDNQGKEARIAPLFVEYSEKDMVLTDHDGVPAARDKRNMN